MGYPVLRPVRRLVVAKFFFGLCGMVREALAERKALSVNHLQSSERQHEAAMGSDTSDTTPETDWKPPMNDGRLPRFRSGNRLWMADDGKHVRFRLRAWTNERTGG
jgi:hypothetical protein